MHRTVVVQLALAGQVIDKSRHYREFDSVLVLKFLILSVTAESLKVAYWSQCW